MYYISGGGFLSEKSQNARPRGKVPFFPQMKPEKKALELTEVEKVLMNLLKAKSPINLTALKEQTRLSNKKWDKAIKGLTKNQLARVEKIDEELLVSVL